MFEDIPPPADMTLHEALLAGDEEAVRKLVTPHVDTLVQRASFLDRVIGDALRDIGNEWERGELSIDEEHRASNLIAESVDRLRPRTNRESKLAVLACPPAEAHDLPLRCRGRRRAMRSIGPHRGSSRSRRGRATRFITTISNRSSITAPSARPSSSPAARGRAGGSR